MDIRQLTYINLVDYSEETDNTKSNYLISCPLPSRNGMGSTQDEALLDWAIGLVNMLNDKIRNRKANQ